MAEAWLYPILQAEKCAAYKKKHIHGISSPPLSPYDILTPI